MANEFPYLSGLRPHNNVALPVATAQLIEVGDHVKLDTGLIVPATVAGDDATFLGLAVEAKPASVATPTGNITVSLADGISRYKRNLSSALTLVPGETLDIASKSELTTGTGDAVAMVTVGGTSVSSVECIYKKSQVL